MPGFAVNATAIAALPFGRPPDVCAHAWRTAFERGAQVILTSGDAHRGELEVTVARTLREARAVDRCRLATRLPRLRTGRLRADGVRDQLRPETVTAMVDEALRRTKLEALPLALLPCWHQAWTYAPAWLEVEGTLRRLTDVGKVISWGLDLDVLACDAAWAPAITAGATTTAPRLPTLDLAMAQLAVQVGALSIGDFAGPTAVAAAAVDLTAVAPPPVPVVFATVVVEYNVFRPEALPLIRALAAVGRPIIGRGALATGGLAGPVWPPDRIGPGDPRPATAWANARDEWVRRLAHLARLVETPPPAASLTDEGRALIHTARADRRTIAADLPSLAWRAAHDLPFTAVALGSTDADHLAAAAVTPAPLDAPERDAIARHAWPADDDT